MLIWISFFSNGVPYEPTFGDKRVQRSFNPSSNPDVELIKEYYAGILDHLESMRNERNGREISLAQTEAETSCKKFVCLEINFIHLSEREVEQ